MDMTYIFSGKKQTKKPSTLKKKREEPAPRYIDKSRAIAIARQLKITRIGKVSLRINSKNSLESELTRVSMSDNRMTSRKALMEKEKGLKTATYIKDSAVGKCILKTNDYAERQLRHYMHSVDDDKEKTNYNMKQRKRDFISKKWHFNHEPITSVDEEILEIFQPRPSTPVYDAGGGGGGVGTDPAGVYKSPFSFMLRRSSTMSRKDDSRLSGVFLTTPATSPGMYSPGGRMAALNEEKPLSSPFADRRASGAESDRRSSGQAQGTPTSRSATFLSRPSTSEDEKDGDRKRSAKHVSILDDKPDEKKSLSRNKGRHPHSVVPLIPKRMPGKIGYGAKIKIKSPVSRSPEDDASEQKDGMTDERFTSLAALLVPDSNHEAQLIASQYAARFAYKPMFSHRRPKDSQLIKTDVNSKKFDDFLDKKKIARRRKTSSRSIVSV